MDAANAPEEGQVRTVRSALVTCAKPPLGQVQVWLVNLDLWLLKESAQRVIQDWQLGAEILHPSADQQQGHEEEQKQLHREKG